VHSGLGVREGPLIYQGVAMVLQAITTTSVGGVGVDEVFRRLQSLPGLGLVPELEVEASQLPILAELNLGLPDDRVAVREFIRVDELLVRSVVAGDQSFDLICAPNHKDQSDDDREPELQPEYADTLRFGQCWGCCRGHGVSCSGLTTSGQSDGDSFKDAQDLLREVVLLLLHSSLDGSGLRECKLLGR
jgi:hypothetical protein